jgi:hypothetical protein
VAQQRVVLVEPAGQRALEALELGDLGPHPSLGHLREHFGVALTGDERVDHLPTGLGQHARRHRRQLHAGVFENLVEPLGLPRSFFDDRPAIAGQVPQRPERLG